LPLITSLDTGGKSLAEPSTPAIFGGAEGCLTAWDDRSTARRELRPFLYRPLLV
jgi:hypothetical protein